MSRYAKEVNACLSEIQKGNRAQFAVLFDLTANHLRVIAKKYLFNKSDCDDVVSDAYLKVYQYINTFDNNQDGYNWLCKIVENVAFSYNEKEKTRRDRMLSAGSNEVVENSDFGIDIQIDIENAFSKLDEQSQEILYEYYYLQYTLEEIAKKRGMGKSTVHKRIKKCLKKIENYFK